MSRAPVVRPVEQITDQIEPDFLPMWSPDGSRPRIAFHSFRDGDREIYVADLESGFLTRLTHDPGSDVLNGWSPDGQTVSYASDSDGNWDVYTVSADGGESRRLTVDPGHRRFR